MKQLLIETTVYRPSQQQLTEALKGDGNILLRNVLLATAEEKNGNGRYYPKELWEREVSKFNQKINEGTTETAGELDHPESEIINLKNVSHGIRKLWWEGKEVRGDIEVFCDSGNRGTSSGRILGALLRNNYAVGFSSRGMGSLEQRGDLLEVQDDFSLLTWDSVSNPSNQGSWSRNLNESKIADLNPYNKVNMILTDILCANGSCPLF